MPQRLFGLLALGDVAAYAQHRVGLPIPQEDGGLGLHVNILAGLVLESELVGRLLTPRFSQLGNDSKSPSHLGIVQQRGKSQVRDIFMLVTEKLKCRGVGIEEPPLEIKQVDAVNGGKEGLVAFHGKEEWAA